MTKEESYQIALERIGENKKTQSTELDLSSLSLTELPAEIAELRHLESLNLSANKIYDISILENLENLHTLDLSNNEIYDLETIQEIIKGFNEIKDILMTTNPENKTYQRFKEEVEAMNLKFQESGCFEYSGSKDFQRSIMINPKLGKIFLQDLGVKYNLNSEIIRAAELIVSIEKVSVFPFIIKSLPNLQKLNLAGNQLGNIVFLQSSKQLKQLDLNHNRINPDNIFFLQNFKQLELLDLTFNRLDNLQLEGFESLIEIKLSNNYLEKITLKNLPKVKSLVLSNLGIRKIVLEDLNALESLDLGNNEIEDIATLQYLKSLKFLSLIKNRIISISQIKTLVNLLKLEELRLYGNPIQEIPKEYIGKEPRYNSLPILKKTLYLIPFNK